MESRVEGNDGLPDAAFVVRGGRMESSTLMTNALDHNYEFPGDWAISVASHPEWTVEEIAVAAPFRNRDMRVSTVGDVRSLGHDVTMSGKPPHADLRLNRQPDEDAWEELRQVFGPTEPNPRYNKGES